MSEIKVNSIKNTNSNDGGVAIDSSGHVQVDGLQMPTAGALFARNKIINASMEVAQRGTSSTANGYVSLDRWYVNQSGGSTTFSQETFAAGSEIGSLKNYAKLDVTTSSDFTGIFQRIEDVRTVPAGTITISFQAKGTNPSGNLAVYLAQNFGDSGSSDVDITQQTVTLTSSWQRFDLQFTIPSIAGKTIGNNSFLQISIGQGTNTGTSAYELNITGVQLEVGSKPTVFEHRIFGDELARCQRYYCHYGSPFNSIATGDRVALGYCTSSTSAKIILPTGQGKMRANPTADSNNVTINDAATNETISSFADVVAYNGHVALSVNTSSGLTEGRGCNVRFSTTDGKLSLDAEL